MKLVRKVAEWNSGGEDEEERKEKDRPSEEDRKKAREHLKRYNPQIPGKVVYIYRFQPNLHVFQVSNWFTVCKKHTAMG